jgi:hypothetical protein
VYERNWRVKLARRRQGYLFNREWTQTNANQSQTRPILKSKKSVTEQ